jgi:2-methylcitrate dehydratase PrpD
LRILKRAGSGASENMMIAEFVAGATPPDQARCAAARALLDTIGVMLAGASEACARSVQQVVAHESSSGPCTVVGTPQRAAATGAALANGTAAHAHDFDDMCFVSLAHPSAPLVAAGLAVAELTGAGAAAMLDAYIVGFELEARLGRAMNPRHYQRGWHCTSTLGTMGAAAAASRLFGLAPAVTAHALSIAASEASGLKENFGTMVKPLHGGLAARNGVAAALFARAGMDASASAIEGRQGFLAAMDSESPALGPFVNDLGSRWEILETGITVKLYPSCAATHPALDALLDLKRRDPFCPDDVQRIEIGVDAITPTVLLYDRPSTGLEAKFSMPFCAAAAVADGCVGLTTFSAARIADPILDGLRQRIAMHVDAALDPTAPALTQARVRVALTNGRVLCADARGARGYHPDRPATEEELAAKFLSCATIALTESRARAALAAIAGIEPGSDVRALAELCATGGQP